MNRATSKPDRLRLESVWPTSLLFSLLVLGGYRVLEHPGFLLMISGAAMFHLLACVRFAPRPPAELVLSQSVLAVATLSAVALHIIHVVGGLPPGLWGMLASFGLAELKQTSTYLYFAGYLLAFVLAIGALLFVARVLKLRSEITAGVMLSTAYAGSAVNLAVDYSMSRPLYHVSGPPEAEAFFFAAGLFGLEFSLPLHMILLLACGAVLVSRAPLQNAQVQQR